MSEQKNSGFPFADLSGGEGLDIDAIFGGVSSAGAPGDVNPFEAALTQQAVSVPQAQEQNQPAPQAQAQTAESTQPVPQAVQQPTFQSVQPVQPAPVPAPVSAPTAPAAQPRWTLTPSPPP